MQQSISLITLGTTDYARALEFYAALGWAPALEVQETAFFQLNGLILSIWSRSALAEDSVVSDPGGGWGGITIAHNERSPEEVDATIELARAAGATIAREPGPTSWGGYSGVFHDPDGHAWEVAHNPGFTIAEDGSVRIS